jgi:hypothetical protein
MEGPIRRHRRTRLLLYRTKLLALNLCIRNRRMDLLLRYQRRYTTAHSQCWIRGQLLGYCYSAVILQDCVDLHVFGCDMVCDKVQRSE